MGRLKSAQAIRTLAVFFVGIVGFGSTQAHAVELDLVGAATYGMYTAPPTTNLAILGGGLVFNFRMGRAVTLELGGLYKSRKYTDSLDYLQTMAMIDVPVGFLFTFGRGVGVDLGGYYSYALNSSESLTGQEYGFLAGIRFRLPITNGFGLVLHPQYRYSLGSWAGPTTFIPHELLVMAGITF